MKNSTLMKRIFTPFLILFFVVSTLSAQEIMFMYSTASIDANTGEPADMPTIRLLEEAGYTVHHLTSLDISTYTDEQIDSLNSTDLIYIGRSVVSGNFESPKKELWNDISTPIMTGAMWALRNTKMNWFETADCSNIDDPIDAVFQGDIWEDDPVFEGLSGTIDWFTGPYSTINGTDAGNGQVLATKSDNGYVLFVRFEADTEFYPGSVDMPAGPRTFFGSGSDNMSDDSGNKIYNYLGYSDEVLKIFLNEVAFLTGVFEPGNTAVDNKGFNMNLSVYPNPAIDQISVEMDQMRNVEIIDMAGRMLYSYSTTENNMSIDVSSLNTGMYLVKVSDKNNNTVTKAFGKE